jgi:hypothetical protein
MLRMIYEAALRLKFEPSDDGRSEPSSRSTDFEIGYTGDLSQPASVQCDSMIADRQRSLLRARLVAP